MIYDSRDTGGSEQLTNRRLFIDRYKSIIKKNLEEKIDAKDIKDGLKSQRIFGGSTKEIFIEGVPPDDSLVLPGNDQWKVGDIIRVYRDGQGEGGAGNQPGGDGDGSDSFSFVLTKEEIIDIYFEGLELPDMVKKGLKKSVIKVFKNAGYCKEGIPPRLSIKKTFESAIARRIANKREDDDKTKRKSPFLDDVDLRYIRKTALETPYTHAVMICLMDVSGSMGEHEKFLSKKFYILLHLFLSKFYKNVELVFIRYHSKPKEVEEDEFFYGKETGGTQVIPALELVQKVINRYDSNTTNLYLAWATDGDYWESQERKTIPALYNTLAPQLQYTTYLQVSRGLIKPREGSLWPVLEGSPKMGMAYAHDDKDIYPAFRELFKKRGLL